MADRMTKKERREAAKRARMEAQRRAAKQRLKRRIYSAVVVLGVIALIVFLVIQSQQAGRERTAAFNGLAREAGCSTIQTHEDEGQTHVADTTTPTYKQNPPTSGDHFGGPAPTGVHPTAVPDGNLVHNMEHGHTIFWYQPTVDQAVVAALTTEVQKDPTRRLLVPRANMPEPVAFTVWNRSVTCDGAASAEKIAEVADRFAEQEGKKGPEGDIPGQPGTGAPPG